MTTDGLPKGWARVTVGELLVEPTCNGISVKGSATPPGVPALRLSAMTASGFNYAERRYIPITDETAEALSIREGDLFVSRGNGSLHLVGRATLAQKPPERIVFPDTMIRLRVHPGVTAGRFINLVWQSREVRQQVEKRARTTAGIYKISQRDIEAFTLPLPPLAEQRRIVEKVEELFSDLDAGVAALERVWKKLTRYRSAVLHAAVTGRLTAAWRAQHGPPAEPGPQLLQRILAERRRQWEERTLAKYARDGRQPPKGWRDRYPQPAEPNTEGLPELAAGWCWASGSQLILDFRSGSTIVPIDTPAPTRILRSSAVRPGRLHIDDFRYLPVGTEVVDEDHVRTGDLLFVRLSGSLHLVGACALVDGEVSGDLVFPDRLFAARCVLPPMARLLEIVFQSRLARNRIEPKAKSTAGHQRISMEAVLDQPVPLPPITEQAAIVEAVQEKLSQIDALEAEVEHGLARAGRLRQSILKAAFDGRLVPQDPNDEPAAALLERLRNARTAPATNGDDPKPARTRKPRRNPR